MKKRCPFQYFKMNPEIIRLAVTLYVRFPAFMTSPLTLSFLVPSSSGLAVLSMPIMAPLADFAGVYRYLVVNVYRSARGLVNLITPTSAVVIGGLATGRVPYGRWIAFVWPLLLILTIFTSAAVSIAAFL